MCDSELPKPPEGMRPSLLVLGDIPEGYPLELVSYLKTEGAVPIEEALSALLSVFAELSDWDMRLQEASNEPDALQHMGVVAAEAFDNDLCIYDAQFFMIYHHSHPLSLLAESYPSKDMSYVVDDEADALYRDKTWQKVSTGRLPGLLPAGTYPVDSLIANVRAGEAIIARLSVDATVGPIRPSDWPLLHHVSRRLQSVLMQQAAMPSSPAVKALFSELVEQVIPFDERHEQMLAQIGWTASDTYQLMLIRPEDGPHEPFVAAQVIQALQRQYEHSITYDLGGALISVCDVSREMPRRSSMERIEAEFGSFLERNHFICGDSGTFRHFSMLRTAYQKALLSLECGQEVEPELRAHSFERLASRIMIRNVKGALPTRAYCTDSLRRLAEYDRLNETELLDTLRTYLRSGLNATETARELFVHKTTFYYRLRRIEEEAGIDLSDYHTRLYLELMFEMLSPEELRRL